MNFNNFGSLTNNTNNNNNSIINPNCNMDSVCNLLQSLQTQYQSQGSLLSSMPLMNNIPSIPSISNISNITNIAPMSIPSTISNSAPNTTFQSQQQPIPRPTTYSVDNKSLATVHFLWQCGVWTTSTQDVNNFNANLLMSPKIAVIEPKCVDNFDKLSKVIEEPQMTVPSLTPLNSGGSTSSRNSASSSSSSNSIFSANSSISSLDKFDDGASIASGISNFSYQSIMSQTPTPSPSSLSSDDKKQLGSFKNYVFFSNRLTSVLQRKLGKNAVGLEYQALYQFEARKFQYSMLRGDIRIIKDYRNNNGSTDYLIFKFGRSSSITPLYAICERNDRQPERQPWCCQHILTLEEMIEFFNLESLSMDAKLQFLNNIRIIDDFVTKTFNPNMEYNANISKITRMLKHGFYDFQKGLQKRQNEYMSDSSVNSINSRRSRKSNKSNKSNRNRRESQGAKLKNEDKFSYLSAIAHNLGVQIKDLLNLVGEAIENAFLFAQKYPSSTMTQAYIDEERGTLSFELILEAEIYDRLRGVFYKFAVPIVKCQNKENGNHGYYYEAKNILTPKMAVDNIRLNSINAAINSNTWIADLHNWSVSYYKRVDYMWFENIAMLRALSRRNGTNMVNHQQFQRYPNYSNYPFFPPNYTNIPQMSQMMPNSINANAPNKTNKPNKNNQISEKSKVMKECKEEEKEEKVVEQSDNSNKSTPTNNKARKTPRSGVSNKLESRPSENVILKLTKSRATPINDNNTSVFKFNTVKEDEEYEESDIESDNDYDNDSDDSDDSEDDDETLPILLLGTLRRMSVDGSDDVTPRENYGTFSCIV